jgi:hypothetical protein
MRAHVDTSRGDMALTDVAIRALKPRDIRYYKSDGRGLWLEVFPTGGVAWRYCQRSFRTDPLSIIQN